MSSSRMNACLCICFKTSLRANEPVGGSHMNSFALRLVLTQRQLAIRKWPIE